MKIGLKSRKSTKPTHGFLRSVCAVTGISARTARVLVLMVVPGQIIFMLLIYAIESHKKSIEISPLFAVVYLTAAVIQVLNLLSLTTI